MTSKRREVRWGDFAQFRYGKMPDKNKLSGDSSLYPIFSGYRIVGYYDEYNTDENELIIVARGVGGTGDVKLTLAKCYLTNLSIAAIIDESVALKQYLYYYFALSNLRYLDSGSAQSQITISDLQNVMIPLPTLEEQREVVDTLCSLDSRIDINKKINHHLEQMAQAVFEQSFGCCSNIEVPIGEIIDVRDGTHDSPKPVKIGFPLVTSKHLLPYGVDIVSPNRISKADFKKINERSKVDTHDILISMIGTIGLISLVIEKNISFAIKNVGLFKTSQKKDWVYFILCHLKTPAIRQYIDMRLAGSTQKYISLGELRQIPVSKPTDEELQEFNNTVRPIFEEIAVRVEENRQLAALRDTLLPRLMSGELSVISI